MDIDIFDNIHYKLNNKNYYNKILIENRIKEINNYIKEVPGFKLFDNEDINNSCSICLDEFDNNEFNSTELTITHNYNTNVIHNLNIMILQCGHYFHNHCIYDYSKSKLMIQSCPICRNTSTNILSNIINEFTLYNLITNNKIITKYTDNILIEYDEISHIIHKFINYFIDLECMKLFQNEIFNKTNNNNNDNDILMYHLSNYKNIQNITNIEDIIQFIYIISNKLTNTHNINMFFKIFDNNILSSSKWLQIQKYIIQNITLYQLFTIMHSNHNKFFNNLIYIEAIYSNTYIYNLNIMDKTFYNKYYSYINTYLQKIQNTKNSSIVLEKQTNNTILHTISSSLFKNNIFETIIKYNIHNQLKNTMNNDKDIPLTKFLHNINFIKLNNINITINIIKQLSNNDILLNTEHNPLFIFITYLTLHNYNINTINLQKLIDVIKALIDTDETILLKKLYINKYPIIIYYINNLFTQFNSNNFINNIYNTNNITKNNVSYHSKILQTLIDKKEAVMSHKYEFNQTALHLAIIQNFPDFKILINKNKSNLLNKDDNLYTPLHYFILNNKYQYINNYYFNLLIDNKKHILQSFDNNNNSLLHFYLLNSDCIKLSIIKILKNYNNNILFKENTDNLIPLYIYLNKKNICLTILQELVDTDKKLLYKYCDNEAYSFNNALQFYLINCNNIDINIIIYLTNNYNKNIINHKNNLSQTSLHIYVERYANKIHYNNSKKFNYILQQLINKDTINITNNQDLYPLQIYLSKFKYNNNFNNNKYNYNVIQSLIDSDKNVLYYLHNIHKSPLYIFLKYSSNSIKNNSSIIKLLSNNYDRHLLLSGRDNIIPAFVYIQHTKKIYKYILELLLCQSINNIDSIPNIIIQNMIKTKKLF